MSIRRGTRAIALISGLTAIGATALIAQDPAPSSVSIHGYLTQAYGVSRGGMVTGLTDAGTADYRRAAILARFDASPSNRFVVQLAHRRLGDSPTMQFENNIKLDMAFYEHRFHGGTRVRVGKTVMPFGIYNEIRYAGTLQPFYRAPLSVYWEGTYTSETIDGVLASHQFRAGEAWELSVDAFGGSYDFLEFGTVQATPTSVPTLAGGRMQAKNAFGTQLWLTTALEGLRFGLSGRRHTDFGGIHARPTGQAAKEWTASLDGNFEKWLVRAENGQIRVRSQNAVISSRYAQLGYRPIAMMSVNAQSEFLDLDVALPTGPTTVKMIRDNALSINLFLSASSVLKFEAHKTKGKSFEEVGDLFGAPRRGSYFISSFSVSF